jgi:hypothetical protein
MECPSCGITNTDSAIRCQCGFDLTSDDAEEVAALRARRVARWRFGLLLAAFGLASWLAYAQFEEWSFARAAAGLGIGGEAPFPFPLAMLLVFLGWAGVKLWRSRGGL